MRKKKEALDLEKEKKEEMDYINNINPITQQVLCNLRLVCGITKVRAAKEIGMSRNTLTKYEKGDISKMMTSCLIRTIMYYILYIKKNNIEIPEKYKIEIPEDHILNLFHQKFIRYK